MKALIILLLAFACVGGVWAQGPEAPPAPSPLPSLPDNAVVAIFPDGTKLTMGEFKNLAAAVPPQNTRDRGLFLHQYALLRSLAQMAEKDKLDQQSPWKEMLAYQRMAFLAQTKMNMTMSTMTVNPDEVAKYYDADKDKFKQVKVKAIYIAFGEDPGSKGKKALTEEQAKAKAEKLLAAIRHGADFVKLVKESSDDETSRAKGGDFATVHVGDNIPDAMREAVFQLKQGEVSEPVRQPNGYYLFRAEEVSYRPLAEVRDQIFTELKNKHFGDWMKEMDANATVTFPNPSFLENGKEAAPATAPKETPAAPAKK